MKSKWDDSSNAARSRISAGRIDVNALRGSIAVEVAAVLSHQGRSLIVVFATGGTIASATPAAGSGADVRLTGNDLVRALPDLDSVASVRVRSFRQVPSGDLAMKDVLELTHEIRRELAGGASGIVVAQGTDTLEEVSFVLDLLHDGDAPVVVTGAMRTASQPGPDGPANLFAAIRVAASDAVRGLGTIVVLNDEIHAARFVRKRSTTSAATFGSPLTGPLGVVVEDRVSVFLRPTSRPAIHLPENAPEAKVALVPVVFDDSGLLFSPQAMAPFDGVVVAAFGGGHVPRRLVARLREINERVPVVVASRTFAGDMLSSTYAYPGGEMDLRSAGLIFAGPYDAIHARVLLQLLLMAGAGREEIAAAFASGLTGRDGFVVGRRE